MAYSNQCPDCGCYLDPGEACDCKRRRDPSVAAEGSQGNVDCEDYIYNIAQKTENVNRDPPKSAKNQKKEECEDEKMAYNKVILVGNIVTDLELKQTLSGVSVAPFRLAVDRKYAKDGIRETDFIDCRAWRDRAEFLCRNFRKGQAVLVTGSLQVNSRKDRNGTTQKYVEVVAEELDFVGSRVSDPVQGSPADELIRDLQEFADEEMPPFGR